MTSTAKFKIFFKFKDIFAISTVDVFLLSGQQSCYIFV